MSVKNSSDIRCRWHYFRTPGRHGNRSYFSLDSVFPPPLPSSLFPPYFIFVAMINAQITTSPHGGVSPLNKLSGLLFYSLLIIRYTQLLPVHDITRVFTRCFRLGTSVVKPSDASVRRSRY